MYMVAESWLNERTANETRGLTVMTGGQFLLTLYEPSDFPLFALISIMVSLAVVPLAMTAAPGPAPVEVVRLRLGYLYSISPVGCIGILAVGLVNSSFFALAPVFAQESGVELTGIALFMGIAIIAGALSQWPLGHASDRTDRRNVIVASYLAGCLAGVGLALVNEVWAPGILVFTFVFGAFAFPLYSLCMAHSNDFVAREDFVGAASGLLLLYAIGATAGPALAAAAMSAMGADGLFAFTALVHGALALFVLVRRAMRAAPGAEAKDDFVGVPRTAPTVFALDPRSQEPATESRLARWPAFRIWEGVGRLDPSWRGRRLAARLAIVAALGVALVAPARADFAAGLAAYEQGEYAEAFASWRPLAEGGDAQAQARLGELYARGLGLVRDDAEAARWYRRAAEQGNASAQAMIGYLTLSGIGVRRNDDDDARWLRAAAEQREPSAENNLGLMYATGRGVVMSYAEAVKWYRRAAERGDANAQDNLGAMYQTGRGVRRDYAQAAVWYRRAAEQGHLEARFDLGTLYAAGLGVPLDYAEAARLLAGPAEAGHRRAQYNLATLYLAGQGVVHDDAEAVRWFRAAAVARPCGRAFQPRRAL